MEEKENNFFSESNKPNKYNLDWMKNISDSKKISELTIPGTHNSCAYQIEGWLNLFSMIGKTQSWELSEQMKAGIRYFDIRLRLFNDTLHSYHGPADLKLTFDLILKEAFKFLSENKSETLIMQLVSEYDDFNCTKNMQQLYDEYISLYKNKNLYIEYNGYIPSLGELRGKIFFIKIFKGSTRKILNFYIQNNWTCNTINEIDKKIEKIKTHFNRSKSFNDPNKIFMNFLSCSSDLGLMSPATAAKKCNEIVLGYKGKLGIVLADFPGEGLIEYLIMQNFNEKINIKVDNQIKDNDIIFLKHNDTESYLNFGENSIYCSTVKMPLKITFLNDKDYLEGGEAVLLSSGDTEKLFQINKINDIDNIIRNNNIITIEADDGKMKSIYTSYEKKHHDEDKKIDVFDVQLEEGIKNNFEFYFIIEK